MNWTQLLTPPQLAAVGHALLWLVLAGFVLRLVGKLFGPIVQRRFPRVYPWLAMVGGFALAIVSDLIKAIQEAQQGRNSIAPASQDQRVTQPEGIAAERKDPQ